jgi:hypothetical protein
MSNESRNVVFSEQHKLRGAPQRRQGLGSTICRYLPLSEFHLSQFAANSISFAAICRYQLPLFAVKYN